MDRALLNNLQDLGRNMYNTEKGQKSDLSETQLFFSLNAVDTRDSWNKDIECYSCGDKGHKAFNCPKKNGNGSKWNNNGGNQGGGGGGYNGRNNNDNKFKGNCNVCGKKGHKEHQCWQKEENKSQRPNGYTVRTTEVALAQIVKPRSVNDSNDNFIRSFRTPADRFYEENKKIPLPSIVHATLAELSSAATTNEEESTTDDNDCVNTTRKNILVIGDVHGCYDELLGLHEKAVKENDSMQFQYVILVGDLCNKGPHSAKVIRHVRLNPGWFSVRGNHDDGALAAALGDTSRLRKETYQWVRNRSYNENDEDEGSNVNMTDSIILCDDDVHWLSQLPYTIQVPGDLLGEDEDTLIVHAGLIPYCDIQDQKISTMTTIRDLLPRCNESGEFAYFEYHNSKGGEASKVVNAKIICNEPVTWASAWNGPQRIIFGHDARRKLQLHDGNWATGLDTGAVYGGELTGIILPERKIVSVKSKVNIV